MKTRAIETQQSEHDSLTMRKLEDVELVVDKESTKNNVLVENNVSEIGEMNGIDKSSNEKDQQEDVNNNKKADSNNDENNNNVNDNVKGVDVSGLEPTKPLHGILSKSKNRVPGMNGRMESPVNDHDHPVPTSGSDEEPGKMTHTVTRVNKRFPRAVAEIFKLPLKEAKDYN